MPSTVSNALHAQSHVFLTITLRGGDANYHHFIELETEAQKCQETCPGSHGQEVVEIGGDPGTQPLIPTRISGQPTHHLFHSLPVSREWTRLTAVRAPTPGVFLTREENHLDLQEALKSQFDLVLLKTLCRDMIHPSIHPSDI